VRALLDYDGEPYLPPGTIELATDWHGGQSSTLYAILSTGDLTTGTVRPSTWDEEANGLPVRRPVTDDEWRADLAGDLWQECSDIFRILQRHPDLREETDETALTELYNLAEHSFDHWTGAAGSEAV